MSDLVIEGQSLEWLLASAIDAMLIVDREGRIILANPALESMFGHAGGALTGQVLETLLPERFRRVHSGQRSDFFGHPYSRAMGAGVELLAQHASGKEFPVEVSLSPLQTAQGRPLVMATIHDITDRKLAERALQESEARMRAIFETAVDAIITIDERGILERLNPAAQRLFGYAEAEVAGQNVSMLMPPPHRQRHDGYMQHYLRTGEKRIIGKGREVEGLRKDGAIFPMELTVVEMQLAPATCLPAWAPIFQRAEGGRNATAFMRRKLHCGQMKRLTNSHYVVSRRTSRRPAWDRLPGRRISTAITPIDSTTQARAHALAAHWCCTAGVDSITAMLQYFTRRP
ncbi:PAS domain-containing protein [Massilia cavernae]|uniref:Sensor protein FixL n=1 Tax=Massilia cavernae TaxID=2320864 RepID=A0A418XA48_9BURK|nr:PAS domain S-box protein [Massilia cavernae]RJG09379.1 PAS domain S-box protein [Massilia cavernae]